MSNIMDNNVYLSGDRLYGDDLTVKEIESWYSREAEGYSGIVNKRAGPYQYEYHALNSFHCYSRLESKSSVGKVLGIGSAFGEEFGPILHKIDDLVILDPSDVFAGSTRIHDIPCKYVKPIPAGDMPFHSDQFDLITCFGVMHHIPNVTHVMGEIFRCLKPGGVFLIREPIVSQGDWTYPRAGVTKDERGIPIKIFDQIIDDSKFIVKYRRFCDFSPFPVMARKIGFNLYNSKFLVVVDDWVSNLSIWRFRYHRTKLLHKFAPASVVYILTK